ncbi:MAG TPA: DUF4126 domain-containing protein [Chloroflexia bacterium]|nr:DUF4126 domain-containing protein [Chloroflexia bacterium]
MDAIYSLLAGFGLAAPAGLNAWLPLLITGFVGKVGGIKLQAPFDILTNTWVLLILLLLLTVEIFVDKIPAVDTINDIVHTFIRPVAGGILFAAQVGAIGGLDPTVGFVLGLLSAGAVHAVKATGRPLVTTFTGGLGNMVVSLVEDFISGVTAALALFVPILAALIMAVILGLAIWAILRWRARRRRRQTEDT